MSKAKFSGVRISGVVGVVPRLERRLMDEVELFGGDRGQVERIGKTLGLDRRRVVEPGVTTLDLCERGACELLEQRGRQMDEGDAILFVTQTADYPQPCNAAVLHGRLRMGKGVAALDVNLGCSGYVYGLWLAFSLVQSGAAKKVLLLAGDTISRVCHPRDRSVAALFGDGGSATMIEKAEGEDESWFCLGTDGQGFEGLIVPAGGARNPLDEEARREIEDGEGNWRSAAHLQMNGAEVFNFSIKEEPASVLEVLNFAGSTVEEVDGFIFHQANRYILGNIARRLKIPLEKVPMEVISKYGNQSSASIPVAMADTYGKRLMEEEFRLVLSGFGVGLSWGTGLMRVGGLDVCQVVEL